MQNIIEGAVHVLVFDTLLLVVFLQLDIVGVDFGERLSALLHLACNGDARRQTSALRSHRLGHDRQLPVAHLFDNSLQMVDLLLSLRARLPLAFELLAHIAHFTVGLGGCLFPVVLNRVHDVLGRLFAALQDVHEAAEAIRFVVEDGLLLGQLCSEVVCLCQSLGELMRLSRVGRLEGFKRRTGGVAVLREGVEVGLESREFGLLCAPVFRIFFRLGVEIRIEALDLGLGQFELLRLRFEFEL